MSATSDPEPLHEIEQKLDHLGYQALDRFVTEDWRHLQRWLEVVIVCSERLPKPFSDYVRSIEYKIGSQHVDMPPKALQDLWRRLNATLRRQVTVAQSHVFLEMLAECQDKVAAGIELRSLCRHLILNRLTKIDLPAEESITDPHWFRTLMLPHLHRLRDRAATLDLAAPGRDNKTDDPETNALIQETCLAWKEAKAAGKWPLQTAS